MYCENCGAEIKDNTRFCASCGFPVDYADETPAQPKSRFTRTTFRDLRNRTDVSRFSDVILPDPPGAAAGGAELVLAQDEVIVRQYQCANVSGAQGIMTVTNKRMMFNAYGGTSRVSQEVTLSAVSGISSNYGTNINIKRLILGGLLALAGVIVLYESGIAGLILLAIGAIVILTGIKKSFQIVVYAKGVNISPIVVGEGPQSLLGNSALFALAGTRTAETDRMLDEIGAMIQDLQTLGDDAVSKWQNK